MNLFDLFDIIDKNFPQLNNVLFLNFVFHDRGIMYVTEKIILDNYFIFLEYDTFNRIDGVIVEFYII